MAGKAEGAEPWLAAEEAFRPFASALVKRAKSKFLLAESFPPGAFKGILFLSNQDLVAGDGGALFGERMSALANCMRKRFGGEDTPFDYTLPAKTLAPNITKPSGIQGRAEALEITDWQDAAAIASWIGKAAK